MSDLIRLTGLWLNETKDGVKYFSGSLGAARVVIFKNDHHTKETDPDYVLYVSPPADRKNGDQKAARHVDEIPF